MQKMTPNSVDVKTAVKRPYVAPAISVMMIELEQGIAAGSAKTVPDVETTGVSLEWETGTDKQADLTW
jgi:hypothetical protein